MNFKHKKLIITLVLTASFFSVGCLLTFAAEPEVAGAGTFRETPTPTPTVTASPTPTASRLPTLSPTTTPVASPAVTEGGWMSSLMDWLTDPANWWILGIALFIIVVLAFYLSRRRRATSPLPPLQ